MQHVGERELCYELEMSSNHSVKRRKQRMTTTKRKKNTDKIRYNRQMKLIIAAILLAHCFTHITIEWIKYENDFSHFSNNHPKVNKNNATIENGQKERTFKEGAGITNKRQ